MERAAGEVFGPELVAGAAYRFVPPWHSGCIDCEVGAGCAERRALADAVIRLGDEVAPFLTATTPEGRPLRRFAATLVRPTLAQFRAWSTSWGLPPRRWHEVVGVVFEVEIGELVEEVD